MGMVQSLPLCNSDVSYHRLQELFMFLYFFLLAKGTMFKVQQKSGKTIFFLLCLVVVVILGSLAESISALNPPGDPMAVSWVSFYCGVTHRYVIDDIAVDCHVLGF